MKKGRPLFLMSMFACLLMVASMSSGTASAGKRPIVLRLVTHSPAGSYPYTYMVEDYARRFNARANGEYMIEVHAGGALAQLPEYFDAIRVGAVEMASAPFSMFNFLDHRLGIVETPFLWNCNEAANYGINASLSLYDEILQEKFNAKALSFGSCDGLELFSTSREVKELEDWENLLTGAISPTCASMIKSLGGAPTTIMYTDIYESLQKGVIDATIMGVHGATMWQLTDVCKNATFSFGTVCSHGLMINLKIWNKMPPDIRKALQEEAQATIDWFFSISPKLKEDDLTFFKDHGMTVYFLPPQDREKWKQVVDPDEKLAEYGEFGQKMKKIADEANEKFPYKAD